MLPDSAAAVVAPDMKDMEGRVASIVQQNLRALLGGQFAEKEGYKIIERAFDKSLDEPRNAARLEKLASIMKEQRAAQSAAMEYYEQNGSLAGYQGPTVSREPFDALLEEWKKPDDPSYGSAAAPADSAAAPAPRVRRYNPETGALE
jgi:hypothetical protein